MEKVQFYGTGRRKSSVARVRLVAGEGNITVNGRALDEYFDYDTLIRDVKQPLVLTNNENKYDVIVRVEGGGFTGQAGAIRHGISRALLKADEELRGALKKEGFWVVGCELDNSTDYRAVDYNMPLVLVIGSEGFGISRLVKEHCDMNVILPMVGHVNSLNASVATAVLLYQVYNSRHPL